jgi:hypothetical protein
MRITFGIHKDKKVTDLTVDQLHGFAGWLDHIEPESQDMRRLHRAVQREIITRREIQDEDVEPWPTRTPPTDALRRETARLGLTILSPTVEPMDMREARSKLTRLMMAGYTADQALSVARWARAEWDSGRSRFVPLLDIGYLWSVAKFPSFLAAARTTLPTSAPVEDVEPDAYLEAAP